MDLDAATAQYRAHAAARLRGDTAGARRLIDRMGHAEIMAHKLFVLHLLAQVIFEEYGTRPDPGDLAELTERLHDKHYAANRSFIALRAEAIVRAVCGETHLLDEIPLGEQTGYMWAVMNELIEPGITDAELARRFAEAEEIGGVWPMEALAFLDAEPKSEEDGAIHADGTAGTQSSAPGASGPDTSPESEQHPASDQSSDPATDPAIDPRPAPTTEPTTDEERTA